jgi:hypothetical protein
MCVNDYGIKRKVISTRNPQANVIIEHVHQTLGNLIRSFQLQDKPYYDPDDPWGGGHSCGHSICVKIYVPHDSAGNAWPACLWWDMVLNVQHLIDWTAIKARKQQIICKNN